MDGRLRIAGQDRAGEGQGKDEEIAGVETFKTSDPAPMAEAAPANAFGASTWHSMEPERAKESPTRSDASREAPAAAPSQAEPPCDACNPPIREKLMSDRRSGRSGCSTVVSWRSRWLLTLVSPASNRLTMHRRETGACRPRRFLAPPSRTPWLTAALLCPCICCLVQGNGGVDAV